MTEFARAFALMDRLAERTAERLEPAPFGPVIVQTRLNRETVLVALVLAASQLVLGAPQLSGSPRSLTL